MPTPAPAKVSPTNYVSYFCQFFHDLLNTAHTSILAYLSIDCQVWIDLIQQLQKYSCFKLNGWDGEWTKPAVAVVRLRAQRWPQNWSNIHMFSNRSWCSKYPPSALTQAWRRWRHWLTPPSISVGWIGSTPPQGAPEDAQRPRSVFDTHCLAKHSKSCSLMSVTW